MIQSVHIKNYKSIVDDTIELGRINVFIGENGCGKTNILEAVAFASAASNGEAEAESLYNKGVRVAKPTLTKNNFLNNNSRLKAIEVGFRFLNEREHAGEYTAHMTAENRNSISTQWKNENPVPMSYNSEMLDKIYEAEKRFIGLQSQMQKNAEEKIQRDLNTLAMEIQEVKTEVEKNLLLFRSHSQDILSLVEFLIYTLTTKTLRGIYAESRKQPLGINGENLDVLISSFNKKQMEQLKLYAKKFIRWFDDMLIDSADQLKFDGHKLGKSTSTLYFRDKFMRKKNNVFSAENANEGVLHILFYLALFISELSPRFFAIDNIETSLNPQMCRTIVKELAELANTNNKQALITTHNPAILDGLNLHDDNQRLFEVYRNDKGHTQTHRIKLKPDANGRQLKLSEMWTRGYLGALPAF